jgi:photosystem II stability/assembly factor-like uncharacterized protein
MVTPVTCASTAPIGTWQDVSPAAFKMPANMQPWAVALAPDGTVFAAGGNITNGCGGTTGTPCVGTGVYRSADCGGTWTKVSTGAGGKDLETGDPWSLRINPQDPNILYVDNGYGDNPTLFRSKNGGVDWAPLHPDVDHVLGIEFVQAVAMDPTDPKHLVLTFHESCMSKYAPNCLSETTDGGDTWREFSGPAALTGWAEASSITVFGAKSYLLCTPDGNGCFFTSDGGATWNKVIDGPAYGSYGGGAHIAADGTAFIGIGNTGVFFSQPTNAMPLGAAWTLIPKSPNSSLVIDDGVTLYATWAWDTGPKPWYGAPMAGITGPTPGAFANLDTPPVDGANMAAYDDHHHLLYVAAATVPGGIWRVTTR